MKITMERVIAGLRFIAENRNLSTDDLADGLAKLGCDWNWDDWHARFDRTPKILFYEGIRMGAISCGASIIANINDRSDFNRIYCNERLLSIDDDTSIYHFVRLVTGDDTFTKENIEKRA